MKSVIPCALGFQYFNNDKGQHYSNIWNGLLEMLKCTLIVSQTSCSCRSLFNKICAHITMVFYQPCLW